VTKPYVYVTRKLPEDTLKELSKEADVECWPYEDRAVDRETLLKKAEKADGLLTMLSEQIDKELLDRAPNLKICANMAVGYDNVDLQEADKRGVVISNTPDVLTEATADLAFALLMASARRLTEASEYIKRDEWREWAPFLLAGTEVHGKTLGIIGMGRIGAAVAGRAKGFNMRVLYHNRSRREHVEKETGASYAEKAELLETADFVCVTAPLTPETKGMIGSEEFKKMKDSAHLINISRGPVIQEEALIKALQTKQIAGAGLDVFDSEPIRSDHPLLQFKEVTALPHIGSATVQTRRDMMQLAAANIHGVLTGRGAETPVGSHR
jgi:glyoxylate reductase